MLDVMEILGRSSKVAPKVEKSTAPVVEEEKVSKLPRPRTAPRFSRYRKVWQQQLFASNASENTVITIPYNDVDGGTYVIIDIILLL